MPAPATTLPIDAVLPELLDVVQRHARCLLVAEPGAGKTTRVPLALLDSHAAEHGRWLLLEPRRVAARLAATYMAAQLGESPGQTVGYRVRGDTCVGPDTRLEVITSGILIRLLQEDPTLDGVAGILFDEFHERSLDADLGLALVLDVQQSLREDLRLLVMSATLDVDAVRGVLGTGTPVIDCPGRQFPVTTIYRPDNAQNRQQPADVHQARVVQEALAAQDGDVLVFLPGQREIRRLSDRLLAALPAGVELQPLYGQMPLASQQQVLRPGQAGRRRVVLATAMAESSVTVPGVRIVVDAGRERMPAFQPRTGLTRLVTRQVNRASADQRRGRAGREAPGYCYRLWPESLPLADHAEPEINQADISPLLFELARWGIADVNQLDWVTAPPVAALASARNLLSLLGLLAEDNKLTDLGRACLRWPTHPRFAVMLEVAMRAASERPETLALACWLLAWLEEQPGSDETDLALVLAQRPGQRATGAAQRWYRTALHWAQRTGVRAGELNHVARDDFGRDLAMLLVTAYPDRIAQRQQGGRYRLVSGGQALLQAGHALAREPLLIAVALDGAPEGARIFQAVALPEAVLARTLPACQEWGEHVYWDQEQGRLIGEARRGIGAVVLARRPLTGLPKDQVRAALIEALRAQGSLPWSADDRQLLGRLRLLRNALGPPWPDVSDARLLDTLELWLEPHLHDVTRLDAVGRLPLGRLLLQSLDWSLQQQLAELAPTHWQVPSGANVRIDYLGEAPVLPVRLQEMYGATQTPHIVGGRVALTLHLLSPARRPVQITTDLAGFWQGSYFEVRKSLRGRYPKHAWPEDPANAEPTSRIRPKGASE